MIDRTQLTEARQAIRRGSLLGTPQEGDVIDRALTLLLDFPTDEQVEAAWEAWEKDSARMFETDEYEDEQWPLSRMRKVLEAVTMIGDEK